MSQPSSGRVYNYRGKKENTNAVKSTEGAGHKFTYKPSNKQEREARRRIWERYQEMRDDPLRAEAMREWDLGDKMYRMWAPEREEGDWRADIILPDGFSAIQAHMQETIDIRPRPHLEGVEQSDAEKEQFCDHIFQFAMDQTDFDPETFKARNCSAIRGTAFTREEYRYETREVQDPHSIDKDGKISYRKREIVDWDDTYTRFVDNYSVFVDNRAEDAKYAADYIYREVLDWETFQSLYKNKPGFKNIDAVVPAGSIGQNAGFFKKAEDMTGNDVELLHYENKLTDSYDVLANNVIVREGPMPNKHKELTLDVWSFYPITGRMYGMGIPKIIYTLVEERRSIRNLSLDRQKMHISKMFLVNDLFDLDEDDLTPRPHGMVKVNTNGLPINQAVYPLEYGDVPGSSLRMDESLKEDERRAHGMDDRPAIQAGGTATEAAIIKESTQRRINLINTWSNWNTLIRLGRKKWSNIQFFYPAGRTERIMENNKWKEKTVYRTVKIKDQEYKIYGDPKKGEKTELKATNTYGKTRLKLDPAFARFMSGQFDVVVDAAANAVVSKPIKQQQVFETFDRIMNNPMVAKHADGEKAMRRLLSVSDEAPSDWMRGEAMTDEDMENLADQENAIFMRMEETGKIYLIPGTPGATERHTLQHINFTETEAYRALSQPVKDAITKHIMDENEDNPNVPNLADMKPQPGGANGVPSGGDVIPPGQPGGPPIDQGDMGEMVAGGDVTAGGPVA